MRTTRASAAIARLNSRDPAHQYSMAMRADGCFTLLRTGADGAPEPLGEALPLDEFVAFVNKTGPQKAVRVSKFDVAFEKQLVRPQTDEEKR